MSRPNARGIRDPRKFPRLGRYWHIPVPALAFAFLLVTGESWWGIGALFSSVLLFILRGWRLAAGSKCGRRDCQVCKYGWPEDGEPLEGSEARRWSGIRQTYESGAAAAEHVYPQRGEAS
jgi:hypothetical protein